MSHFIRLCPKKVRLFTVGGTIYACFQRQTDPDRTVLLSCDFGGNWCVYDRWWQNHINIDTYIKKRMWTAIPKQDEPHVQQSAVKAMKGFIVQGRVQ